MPVPTSKRKAEKSDMPAVTYDDLRDAMSELGKFYGKEGGKARAAKLTPKRRSEIARVASNKRWEEWRKKNKKKG